MHGRQMVWGFFASLLIPVVGMAFCWGAWRVRRYADERRRRVVQAGLVVGSFAVLFAASLPLLAMLPLNMAGAAGEFVTGTGMAVGVAAAPIGIVLLLFGYGRERWLGVTCVLLALLADLAMIVGPAA